MNPYNVKRPYTDEFTVLYNNNTALHFGNSSLRKIESLIRRCYLEDLVDIETQNCADTLVKHLISHVIFKMNEYCQKRASH